MSLFCSSLCVCFHVLVKRLPPQVLAGDAEAPAPGPRETRAVTGVAVCGETRAVTGVAVLQPLGRVSETIAWDGGAGTELACLAAAAPTLQRTAFEGCSTP